MRERYSVLPAQRIDENQFRQDHSGSLEVDSLPRIIIQVLHNHHSRIHKRGGLRHQPFESRKERGVIEGPFGGFLDAIRDHELHSLPVYANLVVPFFDRERICNGQPVAVHLEIRRFARNTIEISYCSRSRLGFWRKLTMPGTAAP